MENIISNEAYFKLKTEFSVPSERFTELRARLLAVKPELCPERARYLTQSFKETEGEPYIIRRAKGFYNVLANMSLFINEKELFAGNQAGSLRACPFYPETESVYFKEEIDLFPVRENDRVQINPEVREEVLNEIIPYWIDKNTEKISLKRIPPETLELINAPHQIFSPQIHMRGSLAHTIADYSMVLDKGILNIREELLQRQKALDLTIPENLEHYHFCEAEIIICNALMLLASRYSDLAYKMADEETDPVRSEELRTTAAACARVPAYPVESFFEALQSFWLVHLGLYIEQNGLAISVGRFDQYMYPYLNADLKNKKITLSEAQEYLDILWIKFTEIMRAYDLKSARYYGGFAISENLVLGGILENGKDATNILSYMCLDSEFKTRLSQPNVAVRMHQNIPRALLIKACKIIREGGGKPELFNDDVGIPLLLRTGVTLEDSRNYDISGCVEPVPPGTLGITNASMSNLAKALELALNNGKCRLSGTQMGPVTGTPDKFKSIEDVIYAFRQQVEAYVEHMIIAINTIESVHREFLQIPFTSLTLTGCLEKCLDATAGGAIYNYTGPQGVGVADVADSLAAIQKLVFEDHFISMDELNAALDNNFESLPELLNMARKVPKYGNDDDYVDQYASVIAKIYCDAVEKYKNPRGGAYRPGLYPVSANVPLGEAVGALPSGRKAGTPLADGISPEHFMDTNGPTAVMRSAAKMDHTIVSNGTLLNQKFDPVYLKTDENINRLVDMIRAYFDLGGWHVQFNVVNKETLLKAQANPGEYSGLLVRVAGYSAFFAELSDVIQNDIIDRTEFSEIIN